MTEHNIERYLQLFGLGYDTTEEELRRTYRHLSLKTHPDKYPKGTTDYTQAVERQKRLNQARETISLWLKEQQKAKRRQEENVSSNIREVEYAKDSAQTKTSTGDNQESERNIFRYFASQESGQIGVAALLLMAFSPALCAAFAIQFALPEVAERLPGVIAVILFISVVWGFHLVDELIRDGE